MAPGSGAGEWVPVSNPCAAGQGFASPRRLVWTRSRSEAPPVGRWEPRGNGLPHAHLPAGTLRPRPRWLAPALQRAAAGGAGRARHAKPQCSVPSGGGSVDSGPGARSPRHAASGIISHAPRVPASASAHHGEAHELWMRLAPRPAEPLAAALHRGRRGAR